MSLCGQIELKLRKTDGQSWTALTSSSSRSAPSTATSQTLAADASTKPSSASAPKSQPSMSLDDMGVASHSTPHIGGPAKINSKRKNWDHVVEQELDEKEESKADPVRAFRSDAILR
jgi:hypothetical protein